MNLRLRPLVLALGIGLALSSLGAFSMSTEQQLIDRATQGDVSARIELAELYRNGQAEAKALEQLQLAADAGSPIAQRLLGAHYTRLPDEASFKRGVEYYMRAMATGDVETRVELGVVLSIRAMSPDLDRTQRATYGQRASRMLSGPAADGHPQAAWHLGYLHVTGPGVMRSAEVAESLITKAADAGQPAAAFWIARHHEQVATTGRDPNMGVAATPEVRKAAADKFIHYLELAATSGHVGAMDELARRYRTGDGVVSSSEAALFWDAKATEHRGLIHPVIGSPATSRASQTLASTAPAHPAPAPVAVQSAPQHAPAPLPPPQPVQERAAPVAAPASGSAAQSELETMRTRLARAERRIAELEAERDAALASVDALAAELEDLRRHRFANRNATEINRQGLSLYVGRDYVGAERMFRIAAESGDAAAVANLGLLYLRGHGVKQSTRKAVQLLRRASDAGNVVASENLAEIYARGLGVDEDVDRAREWYERALAQGSDSAQHSLHQIDRRF